MRLFSDWNLAKSSVFTPIQNYFFRIRIRLFRKFRIRIWSNFSVRRQKAKCLKKTAAQINFKEEILKAYQGICCPYSKIDRNQWVLSRFHAILGTKNWSLYNPDPANNFGSDWIRIHNTDFIRFFAANPCTQPRRKINKMLQFFVFLNIPYLQFGERMSRVLWRDSIQICA